MVSERVDTTFSYPRS
ncbi:hypothetical protein D030_5478A, partial [Vibrio parahaemolyticus AQ3810]